MANVLFLFAGHETSHVTRDDPAVHAWEAAGVVNCQSAAAAAAVTACAMQNSRKRGLVPTVESGFGESRHVL